MPPCLCLHLEPGPVCLQYADPPRPHSIPHQDIQTAVPVQSVVVLEKFEKYGMEDHLPHGNELLH